MSNIVLTMTMARILRVFLENPKKPLCPTEIIKTLTTLNRTPHAALISLENAGWMRSEIENADPHVVGRHLRRYYFLTEYGTRQARARLAELSEELRPPEGDHS